MNCQLSVCVCVCVRVGERILEKQAEVSVPISQEGQKATQLPIQSLEL